MFYSFFSEFASSDYRLGTSLEFSGSKLTDLFQNLRVRSDYFLKIISRTVISSVYFNVNCIIFAIG